MRRFHRERCSGTLTLLLDPPGDIYMLVTNFAPAPICYPVCAVVGVTGGLKPVSGLLPQPKE